MDQGHRKVYDEHLLVKDLMERRNRKEKEKKKKKTALGKVVCFGCYIVFQVCP